MRKLSAFLFGVLLSCSQPDRGSRVDLASLETTSTRTNSMNHDEPPPEEEDKPDDGADESGGTGQAMALNEGAMGSPRSDRAEGQYKMQKNQEDPQLARQQAIEQARAAGILGSSTTVQSNGFAGLPPGASFDSVGNDKHKDHGRNPWTLAAKDRLSTFAADVDTAAYTQARKYIERSALPPAASVRVEEYVNYFKYAFAPPAANTPFAVVMDAAPHPFQPARHIVRVGVATKAKTTEQRKPAHLVFLVDVSGSMDQPDKLPLAKQALDILTQSLTEDDRVSIVTYAGSTRVVLEPTAADKLGKQRIAAAIKSLRSGGGTAMGSGIDLAYERAAKALKPGLKLGAERISRVIVLSDGDANIGAHTHDEMLAMIETRKNQGVTLSTVGFGMGNYNDHLMEQFANKGNGNNFYIDSLDQAKRVFLEDLTANVEVLAKDVKFQVDFDPQMVARYRLVGYENRDVKDDDFRNDKVDAGEIGAGHQVTALYEVELTAKGKQASAPIGAIRIRHKAPTGTEATEAAFPMVGGPAKSFHTASEDFRFAFAVAAFADVLRGGQDAEHWSLAQIRDVAKRATGDNADRKELVELINQTIQLKGKIAAARGTL